jgi:hypothetical protein
MAIEPPTPSDEQLAQWRALVERVRQGDRSQVVAWDEVAAAGTIASYRVLVTQRVHRRLRGAPPCWSGLSLASSRSFGWIPPRPA